jgi:hypothetical protein
MTQTARHFQLKASDTSKQITDLRRKFADIENKELDMPQKKSCWGSSISDSDNEDDPKKEVENLGRKFVILYGMWLRKGAKTFAEAVDEDFSSLAQHRFQNTKSKVQGQLADILELIPQRFQGDDAFKTGWVCKTVSARAKCLVT